MTLNFRDLLSYLVEFENGLTQWSQQGFMGQFPRNISEEDGLLKYFSVYTGCSFEVREYDFHHGLAEHAKQFARESSDKETIVDVEDLASLVLNFGNRAVILINGAKNGGDVPLLNRCYRRFLVLKEVFHVVLRDQFIRLDAVYTNTQQPETIMTLLEQLVYLPFAIIDFDNPDYTDEMKIENAAEFFAAVFLYPLDRIDVDRKVFLENLQLQDMESPYAINTSTFSFADQYKLPRRYVDLIFRWGQFEEIYATYRQIKSGH